MNRLTLLLGALLLGLAGCVSAPEHCQGCLAALIDAGPPDATVGEVGGAASGGAGGGGPIVGSGGRVGTGGIVATGGTSSTGGAGTGGGGRGTGGAASGGRGTGGAATGGRGSGGSGTGGASATGGRGTGGAGTGGAGTGGAGTGGAPEPGLVLRYAFDEPPGGNVAADSSGFAGGPRNGTLTPAGNGVATFAANAPLQIGPRYLNLPGTSAVDGGYVVAPNVQTLQGLTPGAITLASWVYVAMDFNWERIFDFGLTPATGSPMIYMYLTTHQIATAPDSVRFTITTTGNSAQQQFISSTALLTPNAWHHVAVVLPAGATYTGTLYVDGISAGTNAAMTLHPSSLTGAGTPYGYLGRSAFADPYFSGRIDDFRIYNRALTPAEITTLFTFR